MNKMKKVLFVLLIVVQAGVLLLIAVQHDLIDDYGKTIKLLTDRTLDYEYVDKRGYLYVDYEINHIPDEIWEIDEELNYMEQIYVVLEPDESGVYHAVRATKQKVEAIGDEVVIQGSFSYSDDYSNEHIVYYGIESINNMNGKYEPDSESQWLVTLHLAPWGQKSISAIENY